MNGSRILRSVAGLLVAIVGWSWATAWADDATSHRSPPRKEAKAAADKANAATKKISGRALDSHGSPLAGAMVLLTRQDDSEFELDVPKLIAETQSRGDGRFELAPVASELQKNAEDPTAEFQIWIWKPGFAIGRLSFYGQPPARVTSISLEKESPFALLLKTPKGAPCPDATVTPIIVRSDYPRVIPQRIQDRLKTKSAADGRVNVGGFNGRLWDLTIEKTQFGAQTLIVPAGASSPLVATLHATKDVDGRIVLPKGAQVDFAKGEVVFEVSSYRRPRDKKQPQPSDREPQTRVWRQEFLVPLDGDGRFKISQVLAHGTGHFWIKGFEDVPLVPDSDDPSKERINRESDPVKKIDLGLHIGIWCSVVVRDSKTKLPLPGVDVAMAPKSPNYDKPDAESEVVLPARGTTDGNGIGRIGLQPGESYYVRCFPPEGYLSCYADNATEVRVPTGVNRFELPIELARACAVKGTLSDAAGQPLAGVRIRGTWRVAAEHGKGPKAEFAAWTKTDAAGHFQFEEVAAGTDVTLLAVRAGVPLAEPVKTVAGDDKPIQVRAKKENLVALSGRVLGRDHKPSDGAQVVLEVGDSPDPSGMLRTVADSDGSFRTPAQFPKNLKYRLTIRSLLEDVASSEWMCPSSSGNKFPDLIVDRAKASVAAKLTGKEIVARVNGQPISASELLERAFGEPLGKGLNLRVASHYLADGQMTEREFRSLQETAIKKYLTKFVRTRLLSQAFEASLDAKQKQSVESAVNREFDSYLEKLKNDFTVTTRDGVDRELRKQGTSLAGVKAEFRYRLLADECLRSNAPELDVVWRKALAYYQAHADAYATREKVNWQLLEINFAKDGSVINAAGAYTKDAKPENKTHENPGDFQKVAATSGILSGTDFDVSKDKSSESDSTTGLFPRAGCQWETSSRARETNFDALQKEKRETEREVNALLQSAAAVGERKARSLMDAALVELRKGTPFESVVNKFSNGPGAEQGGWRLPTTPGSVADEQTAQALRSLPEGATSPIIRTDHSLRLVHVVSRVEPGCKPFEEVEESLRELIKRDLENKLVDALFSRAQIEVAFPLGDPLATDGVIIWEQSSSDVPKPADGEATPQ